MTVLNQTGEARGILQALRTAAITLCLLAAGGAASAANVLQDIRYSAAAGGKVDITLQFSGPVGSVQAFTTDTPPRIALDLPNTSNGLSTRRLAVGSGATGSVSAAEANGRTRVVVDLLRPAGYTTRSAGNLLVLTVDAGAAASANNAMANRADPIKRAPATVSLANIDFRRGDGGAGRLILRFDRDGAAADMHTEGSKIFIDVSNAQLPENLRRKMDVTDFATPVASILPSNNAGSTRLVIDTSGAYDSMAYQTGNEYVLEVSPKRNAAVIQAAGAVATLADAQRYTGKPVTFNFQDVPVRTVLQLMAEESGLNLVVADSVGGSVTLRLINVPWDQAMDIVLRAKGLDKRRDGNVIWVAPQSELSGYELALNNARISLENSAELVTEYIPISYADANAIAELIQSGGKASGGAGAAGGAGGGGLARDRGFTSPRGSVIADNRTNTLLVMDIPKKVEQIKRLILELDKPVDQVLIEARVVIADDSFSRDLGAKFGFANTSTSSSGLSTTTNGFDLSLPAAGGGAFNFSVLRPTSNLALELSAMEQEGRGEVVSNPRVITSNQTEATITQGDEVGYIAAGSASTQNGSLVATPAFKEATLELKVTPTITQDGRVFLRINLKKDDIKEFIAGVPSLTKRSITTAVMVDSDATVVIGGVYEFRDRQDITGMPWLKDLPILGNLFKKTGKKHSKAELLMFITPHVLKATKR